VGVTFEIIGTRVTSTTTTLRMGATFAAPVKSDEYFLPLFLSTYMYSNFGTTFSYTVLLAVSYDLKHEFSKLYKILKLL
jgi:hypothetical protein